MTAFLGSVKSAFTDAMTYAHRCVWSGHVPAETPTDHSGPNDLTPQPAIPHTEAAKTGSPACDPAGPPPPPPPGTGSGERGPGGLILGTPGFARIACLRLVGGTPQSDGPETGAPLMNAASGHAAMFVLTTPPICMTAVTETTPIVPGVVCRGTTSARAEVGAGIGRPAQEMRDIRRMTIPSMWSAMAASPSAMCGSSRWRSRSASLRHRATK